MTSTDPDFAAIIAHHSRSFDLASRVLPPRCRADVRVVYAYCRRVDDLIDEDDASGARRSLAKLQAELDLIYDGQTTGDPVADAFAEVARRRQIPSAYPQALLDGMASDVEARPVETLAELLLYGYRVASTVGLMMCHVMGVRDDAALVYAARLGVAMQITNICRDVLEDWERGRRYLPGELLETAGAPDLSPETGKSWPAEATEPASRVIASLLALADTFYAEADRGLSYLSGRNRLAVCAARLIYSRIGSVLRRRGCDPTTGRAWVSTPRKILLLLRAVMASLGALIFARRVTIPTKTLQPTAEVLMLKNTAPTSNVAKLLSTVVLMLVLVPGIATVAFAQAQPATPSDSVQRGKGKNVKPTKSATVVVNLVGFESKKGKARVALFTSKAGFPSDWKAAHARDVVSIKSSRVQVTFRDIPAGFIAISAFHDENDDGELNTGLFGAPTEAYGASNDARNTFGPPDWEQARIKLKPGQSAQLTIRVH